MKSSYDTDTQEVGRPILRRWPFVALGLVLGVVVTALAVVVVMRSAMIVRYPSALGFDETVAALQQAARDEGWTVSNTIDLQAGMAGQGVAFGARVKLVKICKAPYASEVLQDNRHLASLMPCTLAVYEDDDGGVYVSKMNTGLMGKVFGGTVAKVMGGSVSRDEARMLDRVVKPTAASPACCPGTGGA
jgi:uncharacterized protein (DUF302 family)